MAVRLLSLTTVLVSSVSGPSAEAGHESAITLEHVAPAAPFHVGDQLQLDPASSKKLEMNGLTVLQTDCWPWVRVRCEAAPKPYEAWVNFARIRGARRVGPEVK